MLSNPEEAIGFFASLVTYCDQRRKVWVSLRDVERIEYDAIVVLLAVMIRFKAAKVGFNGDWPMGGAARAILKESRFFEILYQKMVDQESYEIGRGSSIYTHAHKNVDSALSAAVIEHAAKTVWEESRRCPGAQRIFVELMQNTNNHASPGNPGEKHWWVSVHHRAKEKKVSFTFVDFGVGVFQSLDNKTPTSKWFGWRTILGMVYTLTNNAEIMKLILDGDFHQTVTKKYYRGKGLPGIRQVLGRRQVSNLQIITNDVIANVGGGSYRVLKTAFSGTLVYWELDSSNLSSFVDE
jgi:hypothetical protein